MIENGTYSPSDILGTEIDEWEALLDMYLEPTDVATDLESWEWL